MKIDLSCPVELWQYAMPTEDDADCTFVMNNLSDKVVTSVQVTLACYDSEDMLLFKQTERAQGLNAGVGERFSIMLLPTQWQGVEGVDLVVEKVWFDDATIWRRSNAPLTVYTPNALPPGRALDELRFVAGKDAVGYPQEQEQVWVCVCGRANAKDSQRCCRCERRRESVFASYSRENVEMCVATHEGKLSELARKAREDNSILAEARERQRAAKRRRRLKTLGFALSGLCIVAIIAVLFIWGLPTIRYNDAANKLRHGQYDEARAAFTRMGDYRDAKEQLIECDYREADALLIAGDEQSLKLAMDGFEKLGDYEQSRVKWQQAAYELGQLALDDKRYEDAAELYQTLGDYEDSPRKLNEAIYLQACSLYDGGGYSIAKSLFDSLGSYEDSALKSMDCVYRLGKQDFEAGAYETAAETLGALGQYEDAAALASEANYLMGEESLSDGELLKAGEFYLAAGDYENAADKANDCIYQYARNLASEGEWEAAAQAFARISGYLDSEGQVSLCVYEQAKAKSDAGDYESAVALLSTVTGNDEATQLYYRCNYELAMQALGNGEDERAEQLLLNVDRYSDSDKQLRTVRYKLAEESLAAGDYQAALDRYGALGAYRDSKAKANQCSYRLALQKLEAGDYQAAVEGFKALGSYRDSAAQLADATYQLALKASGEGDEGTAAELLKTISEDDRAAAALRDITMADADKLTAAGDYEGAAELYLSLGDDEEAQERYNACLYIIATRLMNEGDMAAACAAFSELGDYQDAAALATQCAQSVYGKAVETARKAWSDNDYTAVVAALDGVAIGSLPADFDDLRDIYNESCYRLAEALYSEDKPYEALSYYARIPDYKDVADKKLKRRAYMILGEWQSATGKTASFRADGTCDMMGEQLHFRLSSFSLYTGNTAEDMTITHRLSTLDDTSMGIRDLSNGDTLYKFTKVAEADITAPENTPAPEQTGDDMLVAED